MEENQPLQEDDVFSILRNQSSIGEEHFLWIVWNPKD